MSHRRRVFRYGRFRVRCELVHRVRPSRGTQRQALCRAGRQSPCSGPGAVGEPAASRQRLVLHCARFWMRCELVHGVLPIRTNGRNTTVQSSARRSLGRAAIGPDVVGVVGRIRPALTVHRVLPSAASDRHDCGTADLVHGVLAAPLPSTVAAACGAWRSKQGFTQMQVDGRKARGWDRGTRLGAAPRVRQCDVCRDAPCRTQADPRVWRASFLHLR